MNIKHLTDLADLAGGIARSFPSDASVRIQYCGQRMVLITGCRRGKCVSVSVLITEDGHKHVMVESGK